MTRAINITGLYVRYPAQQRWALDDVTLSIESATITWITGALGAGTSTLLLAIAGLLPRVIGGDRTGIVNVRGTDPADTSPLQSGIAYLGAVPSLQLSGVASTVRDEIAVGPMNLGWPREKIVDATTRVMRDTGIEHLATRAPNRLSGGETQRMLLAAMLATSPAILLLDEPFAALDRSSRTHVQQVLRDAAANGTTVVIASDDADTMLAIADRCVVLQAGRMAADGDPRALLAGDDMLRAGAATTDVAQLAVLLGTPAPRPIDLHQPWWKTLLQAHDNAQATPELTHRVPVTRHPSPGVHDSAPVTRHPSPSAQDTVLAFDHTGFAYPRGAPVLHDFSLSVTVGESVGLFGANGAGKSTALRLAMALERPDSGGIVSVGHDTRNVRPEDLVPRAAFLFQQAERQLFATSVRAECAMTARLLGWDAARRDAAVDAALSELGIAAYANEHPYDLPVPVRRLVALAAALVVDPILLLLDEPTAGLDDASRGRVIAALRGRQRQGAAIVAVSHDALFAHEALDRAVRIDDGRVAYDGGLRGVLDDVHLARTAAMSVAVLLDMQEGFDRRADVVARIGSHLNDRTT